ncbi:helix-turn-helix domain-containing protein [Tianweitania populi]|uniref:Transcriptional regulator n=1 Tax=Tianweitania populi TaxID=1607949 RepID=A0A8J3GLD2_9HYPH|nr:helix-turn-helix transcriptional regulator [Tianweitania populi]GHD20940.1 transcriptional regulator [Tianweitania populi]
MARFARPTKEEIRERRRQLSQRAASGGLRFPEDLKDIRLTFGKSQEEFASLIGLTRRQVAEMEGGKANPTYETIMKVGRLFGYRLAFVPVESAS